MRRTLMWVTVLSLCATAVASLLSCLPMLADQAWTLYTPSPGPTPSVVDLLTEGSTYALILLVPLAALSSAGYIFVLDRDLRRGPDSRGFDVTTTRPNPPRPE